MQAEPQKVVAAQLDGTAPRVVILFEGGDQEAIEGLHWSTDAPQGKVRLLARRLADCGFPWLIGEIVPTYEPCRLASRAICCAQRSILGLIRCLINAVGQTFTPLPS